MNFFFKRHIVLLVFFTSMAACTAMAQQSRFIYLQTENKQPFYVKIEKKVFSSSASGYLIIPKLTDGTYTLTLGFPKNEWPEQQVTCMLNKKDAGYILKNFGDMGWGLFNWQTMDVVMGSDKQAATEAAKAGAAVNNIITPVAEVKTITKPEEKPALSPGLLKEGPEKATAAITKLLSTVDSEGMQMIYTDNTNGKPDTIRLLIPAEKPIPETTLQNRQTDPLQKNGKEEVDSTVTKISNPAQNKPVVKTDLGSYQPAAVSEGKTTDNIAVPEKRETPNPSKPLLPNSDCKTIAAEEDFIKLRKKMAAENNDDDMVSMARKAFRGKCFTTLQVKNLGVLFLTDEGKYKFFDAAYPFISDSYNFSSLETQLSDGYFINRFKAMLRH